MDKSESADRRFEKRLNELGRISEALRQYAVELVGEPCVALFCLRNAGALIEQEVPGGPSRRKWGDPEPAPRSEWAPAVHRASIAEPDDEE